jgi:hypothetical protein
LLCLLFLTLSGLVAYYFLLYIPDQERYFNEHTLRDLAITSERLEAAISNYANATESDALTTPQTELEKVFELAAPLKYVDIERASDQDRAGCAVAFMDARLSVGVEPDASVRYRR